MNRKTLEDRYTAASMEALRLIDQIRDKVQDLPAPDSDGITWGHLADLDLIISRLKDVAGDE